MIDIIIVDDEPAALQNLRLLIEKIEDCQLIDSCDNGITAIESITSNQPAIVFLDIQMPEISGFDVIKSVMLEKPPLYIFVTAYDQYAIEAFEVNALDYLLKPFDDNRFYKALQKAKDQLVKSPNFDISSKLNALLNNISISNNTAFITRIAVKSVEKIYFIEIEDVVYFTAENQYVNVFLKNGTKHLVRDSLNRLEEQINPNEFFRLHRSSMVRLKQILHLEAYFNGTYMVTLKNGERLKLSKSRKEALKRILNI